MKTFTQEEWSELTKDDAILNFVSKVNDEAVKKDYWRSITPWLCIIHSWSKLISTH